MAERDLKALIVTGFTLYMGALRDSDDIARVKDRTRAVALLKRDYPTLDWSEWESSLVTPNIDDVPSTVEDDYSGLVDGRPRDAAGEPVRSWILTMDQLVTFAAEGFHYPLTDDEATRRDIIDALAVVEARELCAPAEAELSDTSQLELGPFVRDSETSRQAALANYPKQGSQRDLLLTALFERYRGGRHGATRDELAEETGLSPNTVRPRCVELRAGGWIGAAASTDSDDGMAAEETRRTASGQEAEVLVLTAKAITELASRRASTG